MAFLHAYNAGQVDRALALFASAPAVSDCDYQAVRTVSLGGQSQVASWLRARIADHDRLRLGRRFANGPYGGSDEPCRPK